MITFKFSYHISTEKIFGQKLENNPDFINLTLFMLFLEKNTNFR